MSGRVCLLSGMLMAVGFGGGIALEDGWVSFALHHVGALGASALLACAAAVIASRKGRGFWKAFSSALLIPILLGVIAAYLVPPAEDGVRPAACGGSVSLSVTLFFILAWALVRRRPGGPDIPDQGLSHG